MSTDLNSVLVCFPVTTIDLQPLIPVLQIDGEGAAAPVPQHQVVEVGFTYGDTSEIDGVAVQDLHDSRADDRTPAEGDLHFGGFRVVAGKPERPGCRSPYGAPEPNGDGVALAGSNQGGVGTGEGKALPLGHDGFQPQVGQSPVDDGYRQDASLTRFELLEIQSHLG